MAKYLIQFRYSAEGTKGLLKDGGSKRRAAVEKVFQGVGGKIEAFYYAFGDYDGYLIAEVPDAVSAAAISLTVNATGAATLRTTVLLTPEDIDAAARKRVAYRPPGIK